MALGQKLSLSLLVLALCDRIQDGVTHKCCSSLLSSLALSFVSVYILVVKMYLSVHGNSKITSKLTKNLFEVVRSWTIKEATSKGFNSPILDNSRFQMYNLY